MTAPEVTNTVPVAAPKSPNGGTTCLAIGCILLTMLCSCCSIVMLLVGNVVIEDECIYKGPLFSTNDLSSPCSDSVQYDY